jgi:hypothetical protein
MVCPSDATLDNSAHIRSTTQQVADSAEHIRTQLQLTAISYEILVRIPKFGA